MTRLDKEMAITKIADEVKIRIEGGSLYGKEIDMENANHLMAAAYLLGREVGMNYTGRREE